MVYLWDENMLMNISTSECLFFVEDCGVIVSLGVFIFIYILYLFVSCWLNVDISKSIVIYYIFIKFCNNMNLDKKIVDCINIAMSAIKGIKFYVVGYNSARYSICNNIFNILYSAYTIIYNFITTKLDNKNNTLDDKSISNNNSAKNTNSLYKSKYKISLRKVLLLLFIRRSICHSENDEIVECTNRNGIYTFKLRIHCASAALIKLRTMLSYEFSTDFNTMSAATKYFGAISDQINEELQPYKVQIQNDYSQLILENLHIPSTSEINISDICGQSNHTIKMTKQISSGFKISGSVGNRLILFYCKGDNSGKNYFSDKILSCGNVSGFMVGNLKTLSRVIKKQIIRVISRDSYKNDEELSSTFNQNLCRQVNACLSDDKSLYGVFESQLRRIRHLGVENYITGLSYRTREHDLYDDVEEKLHGDDENIYPTEDYSNDQELYEDYHKKFNAF
ncbi:hypothetical protein EDEG_03348 [Edhazardia aedis USNM 41457]|uniref:Uncharacterized protein n=1 Tax=Edhazardia aedis (strain USNM 41457) TaxID=1003232 RepID=J9DHY3_EDHAE|nr:hypothetical protein EDEG_03348 [Edhazardia aedis USNM 41457]|eukprot:EJW02230.1 hypothetical protein EDEG_03348 [Edhazardia aedis USNM 41457]